MTHLTNFKIESKKNHHTTNFTCVWSWIKLIGISILPCFFSPSSITGRKWLFLPENIVFRLSKSREYIIIVVWLQNRNSNFNHILFLIKSRSAFRRKKIQFKWEFSLLWLSIWRYDTLHFVGGFSFFYQFSPNVDPIISISKHWVCAAKRDDVLCLLSKISHFNICVQNVNDSQWAANPPSTNRRVYVFSWNLCIYLPLFGYWIFQILKEEYAVHIVSNVDELIHWIVFISFHSWIETWARSCSRHIHTSRARPYNKFNRKREFNID